MNCYYFLLKFIKGFFIMKMTFFFSILLLTGLFLFSTSSSLEAREHHRRNNANVQINVGASRGHNHHIVRRYVAPVPVCVSPVPYGYYAPVYTYPASVAYVEQVYVAPRPVLGLSFSWLFR
jgi:hypothetical protein